MQEEKEEGEMMETGGGAIKNSVREWGVLGVCGEEGEREMRVEAETSVDRA